MKNIPILLIFSLVLLFSCEDVIELDLPDPEPQLVVDGWLTNQQGPKQVRVFMTTNYFDQSDYPPVTDAVVVLHDTKGPVDTLAESEDRPGVYTTMHVGEEGATYHITIEMPAGERYASQPQLLREVPSIDSIYYEFVDDNPFQDEGYYVLLNTFEPAGQGDYYRWRQFINDTLQNKPIDIIIASDEFVDGNRITNLEVTVQPLQVGDTCRIEQLSISREAFDFLFLVRDQTAFVGSIFDSPPVPIKGNLFNEINPDKKPLGFFGVSAVAEAEIVVEE